MIKVSRNLDYTSIYGPECNVMFSYIPTVDSGQDRSEVKDRFNDDSKCVGVGLFDILTLE